MREGYWCVCKPCYTFDKTLFLSPSSPQLSDILKATNSWDFVGSPMLIFLLSIPNVELKKKISGYNVSFHSSVFFSVSGPLPFSLSFYGFMPLKKFTYSHFRAKSVCSTLNTHLPQIFQLCYYILLQAISIQLSQFCSKFIIQDYTDIRHHWRKWIEFSFICFCYSTNKKKWTQMTSCFSYNVLCLYFCC